MRNKDNKKTKNRMDKKTKRILAAAILLIAITVITWTTVRCLQVVTTNADDTDSMSKYNVLSASAPSSNYTSSQRHNQPDMSGDISSSAEQQEDIIYLNPSIPTNSHNSASRSPLAPSPSSESNWISRAPTSYWEFEATSPQPPSSSKPISSSPPPSSDAQPPSNTTVSSSAAPPIISVAPSSSKPIKTVNINTATASELADVLPLEYLTCKAIVDYRKANGPFGSVDDLINVDGIGKNLLNRIRPYITI